MALHGDGYSADVRTAWFWHKFGPNEIPGKPKIVSDIKTHGTLHLGISENERGQIRFNIEGLERSYDISWSPRKPRLRSTSRLETTVSPQASSWITPPAQRLKTAQKRKRQIESVSIAPSEVKSETKEDTTLPSKKVNLRKRPKTYSKRDVESPRRHYFVSMLIVNRIVDFVLQHAVQRALLRP